MGAGSVVLLWGSAGDVLVELVHLKQPVAQVGPLRIDHDHNTGVTSVDRGDVDPFTVLCHTPNGLAARDHHSTAHDRTDREPGAWSRSPHRLVAATSPTGANRNRADRPERHLRGTSRTWPEEPF